jgi:hypothetical protein
MAHETKLGNKTVRSGQPSKTLSRKFLWVLLALLSIFLMAFVLAPALPFFVLNHEQKQCAFVYGGDEYVYYGPPEPWQEAQPDEKGMIHTQFGSCNLNEVNFANQQNADACCKQLGYTFIGEIKGNVVKRDYGLTIGLTVQVLIILIYRYWVLIAIFLVVVYFLIKRFKNNANKQETIGE